MSFRAPFPALALAITLAVLCGRQEMRNGWIWLLSCAIGWVLVRGQFGFSGPLRRALRKGDAKALAPLAVLLVLLILGSGFLFLLAELTGLELQPSKAPISLSLAIGAFVFGVGMQLARRCASGTLASAAETDGSFAATLFGLGTGVFLGSLHRPRVEGLLPGALPPVLLLDRLPLAQAILVQLAILMVLIGGMVAYGNRRHPSANSATAPPPTGVIGASGPTVIGLTLLLLLFYLVSGEPLKVLWGLGLTAAHLANAAGWDPQGSLFWGTPSRLRLLASPWLQHGAVVANLGMIYGAWMAGKPGCRARPALWLRHGIGGLLMGYGGFLSYGCNISSFLGGVMSFSLHGWLWLIAAITGSAFCLACEERLAMDAEASGNDPP